MENDIIFILVNNNDNYSTRLHIMHWIVGLARLPKIISPFIDFFLI